MSGGVRARAFAACLAAAVLSNGCAVGLLSGAANSGSGTSTSRQPSRTQAQMQADASTAAAVRGRLAADASLKGLNLSVDTHDGVVTLGGQVAKVEQRAAAESAARSVKGVKSVQNRITVRQAPGR